MAGTQLIASCKLDALRAQLQAFRDGAGRDIDIFLAIIIYPEFLDFPIGYDFMVMTIIGV